MGYLFSEGWIRPFFPVMMVPLFVMGDMQQALAHIGHVGEIGGHGHLVGVALGAGALIVAGWLAKSGAKQAERDIEQNGTEPEEAPGTDAVTARLEHIEMLKLIRIIRNGDKVNG